MHPCFRNRLDGLSTLIIDILSDKQPGFLIIKSYGNSNVIIIKDNGCAVVSRLVKSLGKKKSRRE